ncbi:19326_t:CDS:2, partial [Cetraspora pellucida]
MSQNLSQNFSQSMNIDIIEDINDSKKIKELYPKILYLLGTVFANEIEKNDENAFKYFLTSAQFGVPDGMFAVGKCYYEGKGVKKNNNKALEYLKNAYDNNYLIVKSFIDQSAKLGSKEATEKVG